MVLLYFFFPAIRETAARKKVAAHTHKYLSKNILTSMTRTRAESVIMIERIVKSFLLGSRKDLFGWIVNGIMRSTIVLIPKIIRRQANCSCRKTNDRPVNNPHVIVKKHFRCESA